ncbi:helix-turn-helix transcriptional regulator [uncultured Tateyamaria sp.]|uniref:helix-turn-helix domain-containing protein n=1 Tax=uncultured Tateyamaria sp. TaxID=455651 RepID=UPI0026376986|nr:helix-turn-helix domain-containing protein [uncultured Tateyamaria sp.]
MADTTEEFAHRFNRAVEGHPLAPPSPHGRQAWVLEKLQKETGLTVSANTMSKWFHGTARPRPDNIRKIARVLQVDEVWLTMGKTPAQQQAATMPGSERAKGAALLVAGLIEMAGGRVTFPGKDQAPVDLQVNMNGDQFNAVVVVLSEQAGVSSCVVPEPVGDARILAVGCHPSAAPSSTASLTIHDLTDVTRQTLGGFSVIQLEGRPEGRYKAPGVSRLLTPLESVEKIADPV